MYLIFGTIYDRYVLHLRGIDQIPQISIASMTYPLDWLKDIVIGMHAASSAIVGKAPRAKTVAGL
jgi:cation-dependent mannose-6-phosphate receptor